MRNVLISVIIPVYNAAKFLTKTINSLDIIDDCELELICVDDGSTDNSLEILNNYRKYKNISIIHQENMGASKARNMGISRASGKYILFFDADDVLNINVLKYYKNYLYNVEPDILIGNYDVIDENGNVVNEVKLDNIRYAITKSNKQLYYYLASPFPGNKLYRKEIIDKYNISFSYVRIGQDLNFYLKYLAFAENIAIINKKVAEYRVVRGSISNSYDLRLLDIIKSIDDIRIFYLRHHLKKQSHYLEFAALNHLLFQNSKLVNFENGENKSIIKRELAYQIQVHIRKIKIKNLYELFKLIKLTRQYRRCKN